MQRAGDGWAIVIYLIEGHSFDMGSQTSAHASTSNDNLDAAAAALIQAQIGVRRDAAVNIQRAARGHLTRQWQQRQWWRQPVDVEYKVKSASYQFPDAIVADAKKSVTDPRPEHHKLADKFIHALRESDIDEFDKLCNPKNFHDPEYRSYCVGAARDWMEQNCEDAIQKANEQLEGDPITFKILESAYVKSTEKYRLQKFDLQGYSKQDWINRKALADCINWYRILLAEMALAPPLATGIESDDHADAKRGGYLTVSFT